ncbi:hypothetical protein QCD60_12985 [Pokkaliibacter sp. MBI-7]|uniref:STY0301 family protein n=1 Tax=Pokkaliibacter sp. MBI-7 TaxID=3040600 RepID=UPI00244C88F2|nr:STY0301 family protein [Pokkaliibacter sp. MBI-7]MDH2433489.1 hypothetical protein [Pokkaliibacter sp. MBI-7]
MAWHNNRRSKTRSRSTRQISSGLLSTCLLLAGMAAQANDEHRTQDWQCPPQISETPVVSSQQPGWQVLLGSGQRSLDRVGVYLGPLTELAEQIPDQSENSAGIATDTWQLRRAADDHYLIGCRYTDTSAMLLRALPDTVQQCQARYQLTPSGQRQQLLSIRCE